MKRALTAAILSLILIVAGCASQSEVDDLEQRIADLEAITEDKAATRGTEPLPAELVTNSTGTDDCYIAALPRRTIITPNTKAVLEDDAGTTYDIAPIGTPAEDSPFGICNFTFTFQQAPTDLAIYVVRLEGVSGTFALTRTEIASDGWLLTLDATGPAPRPDF